MINVNGLCLRDRLAALEHESHDSGSRYLIRGIILIDLKTTEILARVGNQKSACGMAILPAKCNCFYYAEGSYGEGREYRGWNCNKVMVYSFASDSKSVIAQSSNFKGVRGIGPILLSNKGDLYVLVSTDPEPGGRIVWCLGLLRRNSKKLKFIIRNFWPFSKVHEIGGLLVHAGRWEGVWKSLFFINLRSKRTRTLAHNTYLGRFVGDRNEVFYTQKTKEAIWLASSDLATGRSKTLFHLDKVCSPEDICRKQMIFLQHSDPDRFNCGALALYQIGEKDYVKLPIEGSFSYPRFSPDGRNVYAIKDGISLVRIDIGSHKIIKVLDLTKEHPGAS
jgi:hypothetical protein